jgi:hypothetical protein
MMLGKINLIRLSVSIGDVRADVRQISKFVSTDWGKDWPERMDETGVPGGMPAFTDADSPVGQWQRQQLVRSALMGALVTGRACAH